MNRIKIIVGLFVALVVVGLIYFGQQDNQGIYFVSQKSINLASIPQHILDDEEEDPQSENPIERLEFERDQLVDPSTGEMPENILQRELDYAKRNLNVVSPVPYGASPFSLASPPSAKAQNSDNFTNMGPYNIGGRTRAVVIDANNEDILLAGGISGGVWKSTDQGASWSRTSALQQHPAVSSIVQDRRSGKTNEWYYSTGEFTGNSASATGAFYQGNGIYKSTDNGDSWELITSTAQPGTSGTDVITTAKTFTITHQLAIDYSEASGTEIYAAGLSEIVRSTDGFQTFQIVLGEANTGSNFSDVAVSTTGKVYAAIGNSSFNGSNGEDGFFKSNDGITWTEIAPTTNMPSSFGRFEIAIDPNNEDRVYFLGDSRLFAYTESTNSWADLSANIKVSSSDVGQGHDSQGGYNLYAAVHPTNENIIFLGGINLMRTTNKFSTEGATAQVGGYNNDNNPNSFPRYPNHHPDNHAYAFFPSNPNKMLTATDGGVHVTQNNTTNTNATNPITWSSLNNGYITTQFYHAAIHTFDLGDPQLIGGMQDNGSWAKFTTDPEEAWTEAFGGDGAFSGISYNSLYVSSQNGNLLRFELSGSEYGFAGNISPSTVDSEFLFVNPYIINPIKQDQLFVAARGKVYYTNNVRNNPSAGSWSQITNGSLTSQVSALAMSHDPEGVLYFGTRAGRIFKLTNTEDIDGNVQATQLVTTGMPVANVSSIAVDPKNADNVVVTFSNYGVISVWYSNNGGNTWSSIAGNLEENANGTGAGPSVRSAAIMPMGNGETYYFVGTSVGLYMTKTLDGVNTVWTQQAASTIGNVVVSNIMARPIEGMIMVSTHGNGCFFGYYETGINPNINYSIAEDERSVTLRANLSYNQQFPFSYEWLKDGVVIEGENSETLTVLDGGDYQVRLTIQGIEGNGISNTVSINLDGQEPNITSVSRFNPSTEEVTGTEVVFQVSFDEDVVNVGPDDFQTTGTASGTVESVAVVTDATVYNVTVVGVGGTGNLGLTVASTNDITDEAGNAFSGNIQASETYTITDGTPPTAAITRANPTAELTDQNRVTFSVTFSENVTNVDLADFTMPNALPNAEISEVVAAQGTKVYSVTISQIISDGVVELGFAAGQDIADAAGNTFDGTVTANETYTIENVVAGVEMPNRSIAEILVDTNPSAGEFVLILPDAFIGKVEFNIVNSTGRSINTGSVQNYQPLDELKVDLRNQADGMYIFEAVGVNGKATVKLLKRTR